VTFGNGSVIILQLQPLHALLYTVAWFRRLEHTRKRGLPHQNHMKSREQRLPYLLVGWNTVARRSSHSTGGNASVGRANVFLWTCVTCRPYLYVSELECCRSGCASVVELALAM
jgi:hypothetical protein